MRTITLKPKFRITNEYRLDLIKRAKTGDEEAFLKYYELNKGLVNYIVMGYSKGLSEQDIEDLHQEALMGLHKGIQKFSLENLAESGKPEGYVFAWVRAYVSRYVKNNILYSGQKIEFIPIQNFSASDEELHSLDIFIEDSIESPSIQLEGKELTTLVETFVKKFPIRERVIARERLLTHAKDKKSLRELGELFNITHERIRQIETSLRKDLKQFLTTQEIVAA